MLNGFINVSQLISEVEEVEQIREGTKSVALDDFGTKVSFILACASLAAIDLGTVKAQGLGIAHLDINAFARDLWRKSRLLITHSEIDPSLNGIKTDSSVLSWAQSALADPDSTVQQTEALSSCASNLILKVVAVKVLLLLAAQSFAAPSEYLKLHLDTIASAVEASLDAPCDDNVPPEERERRWQLWSFLCVLDWTSPGIYHSGSYFIRPEMHRDPPSKVPGILDEEEHSPTKQMEQLENLSQSRYFLKYALVLANLSRRAEDCITRPGPIAPAQAARLCSELDALDHKLSFYQLLGGGAARGREDSGPKNDVNGRRRASQSSGSHISKEHQVSLLRALQAQHVYLSLELGLIRFKLFRHEVFHLMQNATTSGPLWMMCVDACMDVCIHVLSKCRDIASDVPHMVNLEVEGMQRTANDLASGINGEPRPFQAMCRRVIQPASSVALVGQVLLNASQWPDELGQPAPPEPNKTHVK